MNRKIIIFIAMLLSASVLFWACQDEDEIVKEKRLTIVEQEYELPSGLLDGITQTHGMLVFEDREMYEKVTNTLELEFNNYADAYFAEYAHLDENSFERMMDECSIKRSKQSFSRKGAETQSIKFQMVTTVPLCDFA